METFGSPADPPILLIMGMAASMDWWEDEFCERLAAGPRFVIRYDLRDTGQSVTYEAGAPGYSGTDLVEDAVGILDALELPRAHVVGQSMGGALAQVLALEHPERVSSLTLISTSGAVEGAGDLPGMTAQARAAFTAPAPDWSDREAVLVYMTNMFRALAGHSEPFDEAHQRALLIRVIERSRSIEASMTNHGLIDGATTNGALADLGVPTLVIHGSEDPLLPHEHGLALAREIPGAKLLTLERTGHELPRRTWDAVVPAILELTTSRR